MKISLKKTKCNVTRIREKKRCIWNPIPDKNFENRYPIPDSCPVDNQFLLLYRLWFVINQNSGKRRPCSRVKSKVKYTLFQRKRVISIPRFRDREAKSIPCWAAHTRQAHILKWQKLLVRKEYLWCNIGVEMNSSDTLKMIFYPVRSRLLSNC